MNKKLLLMPLIICFLFSEQIQNIHVAQRTDGSGIIEVSYDLINDAFPSFTVEVEVSIDEGDFIPYDLGLMTGDVGENVIPGTEKLIEIQAPYETYSNNVIIKLIASAYMVTSELPFTMIAISSSEGLSSYEGQSIDYGFEIMQNELTNAELVTFLETYEFTLNEDTEPVYSCNDYTDYFHTETNNYIYGCTDSEAVNYNPNATEDSQNCIYPQQVGCTEMGSINYNDQAYYHDCSCIHINAIVDYENENESCDWSNIGVFVGDGPEGQYFNVDFGQNINVTAIQEYPILLNMCNNQDALNYNEQALDYANEIISSTPPGCVSIMNDPGLCEFDCDYSYLGDYDYDGTNDYGYVNIEHFTTQSISFEGSSFVIESGAGTQPALLNYNNCVDGVILALMLENYGLRIPNGEEWIKASRIDETRCWPWMDTDCSDARSAHCDSMFICMTEEEVSQCEDELSELYSECQGTCNSDMTECMQNCNSFDPNECSGIDNIITCQDISVCQWQENSGCLDQCSVCMMDEYNSSMCNGDPFSLGCPCANDCSFGSEPDWECTEECNSVNYGCMNDCGQEYGNSYDYCNQEDMQDCINELEQCNQNWMGGCKNIDSNTLQSILDGTNIPEETGYDRYGFLSSIYLDKFHFLANDGDYDSNIPLELKDIGQYPLGITDFGLYDAIGNAPEIVKFNESHWIVGLFPGNNQVNSFCSDEGVFGNYDYGHGYELNDYPYFTHYGLRLARTTLSE